ncbi:UNVERIFIED_CONTAM: Sodium/hydrogen exchanger 6 [Sesamum calycinum]|uniref:Sodium/hydrogen exchanger 6 n=1 Tax=Sesamum calycinum TaxID=2727403 RepID=A0AAW2MEZ4_9LAMI
MEQLQISPADSMGSPGKEQRAAGVGILLQIMMLVLSFVLGHVLRRHRIYYLPEASASLLIGLIVGGLANISNTENSIRRMISLTLFWLLWRTQSGFSMQPKPFFSNFGAIVTFAIFGTFVASVVTGILVLHNLECCLFVLFPYFSYMLAEGFGLSGIVSILFTGIVLLIGGSTGTMLEALQVVGDGHDVPLGESFEANSGYRAPGYEGESSSGSRFKMKLKEFHKSTASFTALDRNYLTPFFTTQNGDDEDEHDELLGDSRRSASWT